MAKGKTSSPNLFGDFKAPEKKTAKSDIEKNINPPEEAPAEKKPVKIDRRAAKNKEQAKEVLVKSVRKRGRPKAEYEKNMKYIDMTGVENYVSFRAKQENMFVSEFLRYLVMKDGKDHKEIYSMLVDRDDEHVYKDMEKFGIKI